jgi:hypothetical protein
LFRDVRNGFDNDLDPEIVDWMKNHTIGDLEEMAERMESEGSDVSEVRRFIGDLRTMVRDGAFA